MLSDHQSVISDLETQTRHTHKTLTMEIKHLRVVKDKAVNQLVESNQSLNKFMEEVAWYKELDKSKTDFIQDQKLENEELQSKLSDLVLKFNTLESKFKTITCLNVELEQTNQQLQAQLEEFQTMYQSKQLDANRLEQNLTKAKSEIKCHLEKISELEISLASNSAQSKQDLDQMGRQLEENEHSLSECRTNLTDACNQLIKSKQSLHDNTMKLMKSEFDRTELLAKIDLLESRTATQSMFVIFINEWICVNMHFIDSLNSLFVLEANSRS